MIYFIVSSQHVVFKQWVCLYQINHRLSENVAWALGNKQQRFSACCYCMDLLQGSESYGDSPYGELKKHKIHFVKPDSKERQDEKCNFSENGVSYRRCREEQRSRLVWPFRRPGNTVPYGMVSGDEGGVPSRRARPQQHHERFEPGARVWVERPARNTEGQPG